MTKLEESQLDLRRYEDKLSEEIEDKVSRSFLLKGIKNLRTFSTDEFWSLVETLQDSKYTFNKIADWCCVETKQIQKLSEGKKINQWKQTYVGLKHFG